MKEADVRLEVIIFFRERLYVDRFGGIFSEVPDYCTEPFVAGICVGKTVPRGKMNLKYRTKCTKDCNMSKKKALLYMPN